MKAGEDEEDRGDEVNREILAKDALILALGSLHDGTLFALHFAQLSERQYWRGERRCKYCSRLMWDMVVERMHACMVKWLAGA